MSVTAYQQAIKNLEYLGLKQMVTHLSDVIDFSVHNQLSFMDTLIKLTSYEIEVREQNMIHAMVKVGAFPHLKEWTSVNRLDTKNRENYAERRYIRSH